MKIRFWHLLIIIIFLSLTGCVEIVEEIKINPDKSGSISFSLDLGVLGNSFLNIAKDYIDLSMMDDIKSTFPVFCFII